MFCLLRISIIPAGVQEAEAIIAFLAKQAKVGGVEAVNIFPGEHMVKDITLVNVGGQGGLDKDSVDMPGLWLACTDFVDQSSGWVDGVREHEEIAGDPNFFRGPLLFSLHRTQKQGPRPRG